MFCRVFGSNHASLPPAALLEMLHGAGFAVTGHFRGDADGWFRAELIWPEHDVRIEVERFLAGEEGIRDQLNTWAAWLETACPNQPHWLERIIGTTQVFTLHNMSDEHEERPSGELCVAVCRLVAVQTEGIYQIDGGGFFRADGSLIAPEQDG